MRINNELSIHENLVAILNAVSDVTFSANDVVFSDPAELPESDQSWESALPNSVITITGVEASGYTGEITRQYRRVPLDAPVAGAPTEYVVADGYPISEMLTTIIADRGWHADCEFTITTTSTDGEGTFAGTVGDTGTVTVTANSGDYLYIGAIDISITFGLF